MLKPFDSLSHDSPVVFLFTLLSILALVFYFHRRAGSSYGFFNRIYALVMGGGEFYDEEISRFWKERRDVERFNALFNVGAKSVSEIVRFKSWVERFRIDVRLIANLRGRVDLEKMRVVKVSWWESPVLLSILILFTVVFLFFLSIAASNSALLKFNDEGQWLWLDHEKAYSTRLHDLFSGGDEWEITKSECEQAEGDYGGLLFDSGPNEKSVGFICNSFFDEEQSSEVEDTIKEQRFFFAPAAASFLFMLIPYLELMAISRAVCARRHIANKYKKYKNHKK